MSDKRTLIKTGMLKPGKVRFMYMTYGQYKKTPPNSKWPHKLNKHEELLLLLLTPIIKLNNRIALR